MKRLLWRFRYVLLVNLVVIAFLTLLLLLLSGGGSQAGGFIYQLR